MTRHTSHQDSVASILGGGLDCLGGDFDGLGCGLMVLGVNTHLDADVADTGSHEATGGADILVCGANTAALEIISETGTAAYAYDEGRFIPMGEGTALLAGASGIDTLGAAPFIALTGGTTLAADAAPADLGFSQIDGAVAGLPSMSVSQDLAVSLILYRIETFSHRAPIKIGFRTGCAR